jgi:hypothetical protein
MQQINEFDKWFARNAPQFQSFITEVPDNYIKFRQWCEWAFRHGVHVGALPQKKRAALKRYIHHNKRKSEWKKLVDKASKYRE